MAIWGALIAAAAAVGTALIANRQSKKQAEHNRSLAEFQADANEKYLDKQNAYNTPSAQMERFSQAGLNQHLVYGQGSPGNQSQPLTHPDIKPADMQAGLPALMNALPLFNQTRLADSQISAQNAATRQKYALTELNKLQTRVLEKNPLLNDAGFKAIIDALKSTAEIKASESGIKEIQRDVDDAKQGWVVNKMEKEVELLEQRFHLGTLDAKIKAQVMTSKEFQNAILEVQQKFMTDGDITPQHILQFIQILLMKAL